MKKYTLVLSLALGLSVVDAFMIWATRKVASATYYASEEPPIRVKGGGS